MTLAGVSSLGAAVNTALHIAEDEAPIALDLKERLEEVGYAVCLIADNALDTVQAVETAQPNGSTAPPKVAAKKLAMFA